MRSQSSPISPVFGKPAAVEADAPQLQRPHQRVVRAPHPWPAGVAGAEPVVVEALAEEARRLRPNTRQKRRQRRLPRLKKV
jgi:hypothetical protein